MIKTLHIEKFEIRLHESGVLENIVKKGEVIDVEDIKLLIRSNLAITNNHHYSALIDSEELASFTKEAMEYSAKKDISPKILARAILVNNLPKRIVGNFYIKITRPAVITKLFNDRAKAFIWLENRMEEHKLKERLEGLSKYSD